MKILCDRNELQEAFHSVSGTAPLKTPKPILQNVLIQAQGDSVVLMATDLETTARVVMDSVKIERPGEALLPARETSALLKELSDPALTVDSKEFRCKIESGGGSFLLLGDDPAQFPKEPKLDGGKELEIGTREFLEMVRRTGFSAAKEETRYAINGLLLDVSEQILRLVGTDGRRLALAYRNSDETLPDMRAVIPMRSLQSLSRAIHEDEEQKMRLVVTDTQIAFHVGSLTFVSQLLENRFPDYEQVIPKMADTSIEIDKNMLERNLRKVAVLSSGEVRMVKFDFSGSALSLSAESSGVGRADLSMDVDINGAGGVISFNPDYLLDALKVSDLEVIRMDMTDDSTPAKFAMGESYTYVLMPISGS